MKNQLLFILPVFCRFSIGHEDHVIVRLIDDGGDGYHIGYLGKKLVWQEEEEWQQQC